MPKVMGFLNARSALKRRLKEIRLPLLRPLITELSDQRRQATERAKYDLWVRTGRPVPPPPLYKQNVVRSAGRVFGIDILIETGTFEGEMVYALRNDFRRIYSIELDQDLCSQAQARFEGMAHITILHGDSGQILGDLLASISTPVVFWLDAHYSWGATAHGEKETPIHEELRAISHRSLRRKDVILIDDARMFSSREYRDMGPIRAWADAHGYGAVRTENDIIRIFREEDAQTQDW
jgi:hypothetical protein